MVKSLSGVSHRGLTEWLFQRLTALLMIIYTVGLIAFIAGHSPLDYQQWHDLFSNAGIKVVTILLTLSLLYHAWVGMWTILTDYVKPWLLNIALQIIILLLLLACFFYALLVVWSV